MTQAPPVVTREAGTSSPASRPVRRRLTASHLLIALAVVLAFVLNILALQERSASTLVAVATEPIPAGAALGAGMIELQPLPSDFEGIGALLTDALLSEYEGWVLTRAIPGGAVIDLASLNQPGAGPGLRSMSIPIDPAHAAGGSITVGDLVDVITVREGTASYVVSGVAVVSVADRDQGAFGAPGAYYLVVAVTEDEALALAEAIDAGSIEVVRSTGADT